jgi:hypothetical protein
MRLQLRDWMREFIDGSRASAPSDRVLSLDLSVGAAGDPAAGAVRLRAVVSAERCLDVEVDVSCGWDRSTEKALYEALDQQSGSLVAGLLLWEWRALREECEAQSTRAPGLARAEAPLLQATG